MAPGFANPGGRTTPMDLATVVAAVLVVQLALDQDNPASSHDSASSDSVEALNFVIPSGRNSPTGFVRRHNL